MSLLAGIIVALAYCFFNVIAIWAGLSRLHWSVRLAVLGASLSPLFLLPSAEPGDPVDTIIALFAEMSTVAIVLAGGRRLMQMRARRERPRIRVSLLDLLLAVGFLSVAFRVLTWLPADEMSWHILLLLIPSHCAIAAIVAAWAVFSPRALRLRLTVLLVATPLVAAPFPFFPSFSTLELLLHDDYLGGNHWTRFLSVCAQAFLIAGYLSLWNRQRRLPEKSAEHRWTCSSSRALLVVFSLTIMLPLAVVYYELVKPLPIPEVEIPRPNGCDLLVAAGEAVDGGNGSIYRTENPTILQLRTFVESNEKAFDLVDKALGVPSRVEVAYTVDYTDDSTALRILVQAMDFRANLAVMEGRIDDGVRNHLDTVKLGQQSETGGLLIRRLTARSFSAMGLDGLRELAPSMSPRQCKSAIRELRQYETARESIEDVLARDQRHFSIAFGWLGRWMSLLDASSTDDIEEIDRFHRAELRVLMIDLAVQQYRAEHNRLPSDMEQLIPSYLAAAPIDPFDGQPLRYRKQTGGYLIYSIGRENEAWNSRMTIERRVDDEQD